MKILTYGKYTGFHWFRILGYGLFLKDVRINPLLCSQRNKLVKGISFLNYYLGILTKYPKC